MQGCTLGNTTCPAAVLMLLSCCSTSKSSAMHRSSTQCPTALLHYCCCHNADIPAGVQHQVSVGDQHRALVSSRPTAAVAKRCCCCCYFFADVLGKSYVSS
jgi:hypothetical protein